MSSTLRRPALDPATVPARQGSRYPAAFKGPVAARARKVLGDALGLTQFGVNLVTLPPGAWSAQRHWHSREDEFVYVLEGRLTLVTEAGEQVLGPGHAAGFPAGRADGHHLVNRSDAAARYFEIGSRFADDEASYPDVDLHARKTPDGYAFTDKTGRPY